MQQVPAAQQAARGLLGTRPGHGPVLSLWLTRHQSVDFFARNCGLVTLGEMFMWEAQANRQALSTKRHNFLLGNLQLFFIFISSELD